MQAAGITVVRDGGKRGCQNRNFYTGDAETSCVRFWRKATTEVGAETAKTATQVALKVSKKHHTS